MNINEYSIITNRVIDQVYTTLTANNYHMETSLLNCFLALGLVPYEAPEYHEIWKIFDGLQEIEAKHLTQGFLKAEDLEIRQALDKKLEKIVRAYS